MSSLTPKYPVLYNRVIDLQRGNPFRAKFTLGSGLQWPFGADALLTFADNSGNVLDVWEADNTVGGCLNFSATVAQANNIAAGSSWTLTVDMQDGFEPQLFQQGTVVRVEAPFPGQSPTNVLDAVTYSYTFATSGILSDSVWNILTGQPVVYDNSTANLPNAVAAGAPSVVFLDTGSVAVYGDASPWSQASMLYYAPLPSDPVSMNYNVVNGQGVLGGETWIVVCSAYDMSSGVAFFHQQFTADGSPAVGIATMSGPTTFDVQESVSYTTDSNDNFVAQYNPATNTYALFLFGNTSPLVTWTDSANVVPHGPGYRYVGFSFESGLQAPGVEICNWNINPGVVYSAAEYSSNDYTANATSTIESWAAYVDLVGVGGGGGGNGEDLIDVGFGGLAGVWGATTLTVGATGPTGIKAGATVTVTVGQGGAGGAYFTPGSNGTATTFSWPDAANTTQTLTCAGGLGGLSSGATNITSWGDSPGNLTYQGKPYVGGAVEVDGVGNAPGGAGSGGLEFQYGFHGAIGEAWVVSRQS